MRAKVPELVVVFLLAIAVCGVAGVATADGNTTHTDSNTTAESPTLDASNDSIPVLPDGADAFLQSERNFWAGRTLYFDGPNSAGGDVYSLFTVADDGSRKVRDDFLTQLTLDSDGDRLLDTGRSIIGPGEYVLLDTDMEAVVVNADGQIEETIPNGSDLNPAVFTVRRQNVDASVADTNLTRGNATEVTLSSNRALYEVNVRATGIDDDNLSKVFPAAANGTIQIAGSSFNVTLDSSTLKGGKTYEFTFEVTDTSGTDSVNMTVNQGIVLPGSQGPAQDVDGDSLREDVDGDGDATVFDAVSLYNYRSDSAVQNNSQSFDFDGDGKVDVFDAIALANEVQ